MTTPADGVRVVPAVLAHLEEGGRRGFLGPRPAADHAVHAGGFALAWTELGGDSDPVFACDLGSGAGVPGLILATGCWPMTHWTLLDAMSKRCSFLTEGVESLGLQDRVDVACGRAEQLGRVGEPLRGKFDLVTSRGFGRPSSTAEAAAPLLSVGGVLIVSEPPDSDGSRWPVAECQQVGLVALRVVRSPVASFMALRLEQPVEDRFPRSPKAQSRAPLF